MGVDQLARLLGDAASDVPAPSMAGSAWARARQIRRRRRTMTAAGVVAIAAATLAVAPTATDRLTREPVAGTTPTAAAATTSAVAPSGILPQGVHHMPATVPARSDVPLPATA